MSFSRDWNEAQPTDSTYAYDIDDYNRYLRVDCSDRLKNMIYGFIAGENTYAQHFQYIDFRQQSSAPSQPAADFLRLYVKAVSNVSELFWRDDVNSERQLTSGGKLNVIAGDFAADAVDEDDIQLANDAYLTAKDAAGTGTVDLIKAGANDLATLPDSAEMASNAAPVEAEAIVNKKYVDDSIAAEVFSPDPMTGADDSNGTITFPNGFIMKWGKVSRTGTDTTVTFAAAFPTACFQAFACGGAAAQAYDAQAHTITSSSFKIRAQTTANDPMRWFAIGR